MKSTSKNWKTENGSHSMEKTFNLSLSALIHSSAPLWPTKMENSTPPSNCPTFMVSSSSWLIIVVLATLICTMFNKFQFDHSNILSMNVLSTVHTHIMCLHSQWWLASWYFRWFSFITKSLQQLQKNQFHPLQPLLKPRRTNRRIFFTRSINLILIYLVAFFLIIVDE